ncbi:helix-turn-helix transcriptional regulator [Bdellovibrio sp. NC01]|uniref:helix-turn-helix domain-containing protein n=1 Tax=Bdellovibrio sp. NC01 TaxID=2220073 RepID=UPI00143DFB22|nr:helix-turn-helix transcriptional regulator [Bdellovibrio sp. NC01]
MTLSNFIKKHRKDACLTQKEAVELLGYKNSQFLSNLEIGHRKPPVEVLKRMCKVYKVSEDEMLEQYVEQARIEAEKSARRKWEKHFGRRGEAQVQVQAPVMRAPEVSPSL